MITNIERIGECLVNKWGSFVKFYVGHIGPIEATVIDLQDQPLFETCRSKPLLPHTAPHQPTDNGPTQSYRTSKYSYTSYAAHNSPALLWCWAVMWTLSSPAVHSLVSADRIPINTRPLPKTLTTVCRKGQKKKPQASLTLSIRVLSIRKNGPNQQRLYCIARRFGDDGLHSLRSGNFAVAGTRCRIWVFSAGFWFSRWILFGSLSHGSFEALDYYCYYYYYL